MPAISGITRDASGTPCAALVVALRRSDMSIAGMVFSDASTGAYSITTADTSPHIVHRYFGAIGDINAKYRRLGLHLNNFTEVTGKTIEVIGGASVSTDHLFSGNACVKFSAAGGYLKTYVTDDLLSYTDFSIRSKIYLPNLPSNVATIFDGRSGGNSSNLLLSIYSTGTIFFTFNGSNYFGTNSVPTNRFVDIELTKIGSSIKSYIDGVNDVSLINANSSFYLSGPEIRIGGSVDNYFCDFYMAEFELFNGKAIHTSNFTPPSTQFIDYLIGPPTENAQIFDYVTPV